MEQTPLSVLDINGGYSRQFTAISRYYKNFYQDLERSGVDLYRMTRLGAWATSRAPHVFFFFKTIGLGSCRLFLDLGSGDGIVSCIAGLFTRSIGIEIDWDLCSIARNASSDLGLDGRVSFICGDFLDHHIDQADCLYLYPDKPFDRLGGKLVSWKGTILAYGPHLPPRNFQPMRTLRCGKEQMVVYREFSSSHLSKR